ncbi:MAG: permease [bacterium]
MKLLKEHRLLVAMAGVFALFYFAPFESTRVQGAVLQSLQLAQSYAREHVLLCLVPAFFIAGAIGVFLGQSSIMKYLGADAKRVTAYGVASVSGSVLAVCSCTILPLFAGIYRMGAGLGPAITFLYAGPAINVLAIILTSRVLGIELGLARAVGAIVFSVVIGLIMHLLFRSREVIKPAAVLPDDSEAMPLGRGAGLLAVMIGILVFANWGQPQNGDTGLWSAISAHKWLMTSLLAVVLGLLLIWWERARWWLVTAAGAITAAVGLASGQPVLTFSVGAAGFVVILARGGPRSREWLKQTARFARQILPLLFFGVLVSGLLLGQTDDAGLIPSSWVANALGGNSLGATFLAAVSGAFMYFATLTEVPILQGLINSGMGRGPALALLLAGPALSLPSMLVIRSVMGTARTLVFVLLVVVMATVSGLVFSLLA